MLSAIDGVATPMWLRRPSFTSKLQISEGRLKRRTLMQKTKTGPPSPPATLRPPETLCQRGAKVEGAASRPILRESRPDRAKWRPVAKTIAQGAIRQLLKRL